MQKFNVFKLNNNKPMVYSLESAKIFLSQCKVPFRIYNQRGYYEFRENYVGLIVTQDEWVEIEKIRYENEAAITATYKLRKIINEYFKR